MIEDLNQTIYRAVDVISPGVANRLGVVTQYPVFAERIHAEIASYDNVRGGFPIYRAGSVTEGVTRLFDGSKGTVFAFPSLTTAMVYESVGYFGAVRFSGFVAFGQAEGESLTEPLKGFTDLCTKAEGIRVQGFKAFVNEKEVSEGFVREFIHRVRVPYLIVENGGDIARSRVRYAFTVSESGEVNFQM